MNNKSLFPRLLFIPAALTVLALTGCMSMVMNAGFSSMKSPDYIPLHKNAKVGDYALLESFTVTEALLNPETVSLSKYEVTGKEGDLYIVTLRYIKSSIPAMENFGFEYKVDKNGSVKQAFLLKGKGSSVKKTPIFIARPGETGFVVYTDLSTSAKMKNATKTFPNVRLFQVESFSGDAVNNSKMTTYYSFQDDIPFLAIYGRTYNEMNYVSSSTSQIGNIQTTLYSQESTSMATITKLVEAGNSIAKTSETFDKNYEFIK